MIPTPEWVVSSRPVVLVQYSANRLFASSDFARKNSSLTCHGYRDRSVGIVWWTVTSDLVHQVERWVLAPTSHPSFQQAIEMPLSFCTTDFAIDPQLFHCLGIVIVCYSIVDYSSDEFCRTRTAIMPSQPGQALVRVKKSPSPHGALAL